MISILRKIAIRNIFSKDLILKKPVRHRVIISGINILSLFYHIQHKTKFENESNRFANKYKSNGKEYRTLYKAFGLRFIIDVSGTGRRFSVIPLFTTIGAGIGLLSIGSYIADFVLLNMDRRKELYKNFINLYINERDERKLNEAIEEVKHDLNDLQLNTIDIEKSKMIDNEFVKRV